MNIEGQITNTEKVRPLKTENWKTFPPSTWILKLFKGGRKYINIWSTVGEIKMFSSLISLTNLEFRNQFQSILNILVQSKLNTFLIIYGSEIQNSQYLIFLSPFSVQFIKHLLAPSMISYPGTPLGAGDTKMKTHRSLLSSSLHPSFLVRPSLHFSVH